MARKSRLPSQVTVDQIVSFSQQAKDNHDVTLAAEILRKSDELLLNEINSKDKATLQAVAANAAIIASDTGNIILDALREYIKNDKVDSIPIIDRVQQVVTPEILNALRYLDSKKSDIDIATVDRSILGPTDFLLAAAILSANGLKESNVADPNNMTQDEVDSYNALPDVVSAKSIFKSVESLLTDSDQELKNLVAKIKDSLNLNE